MRIRFLLLFFTVAFFLVYFTPVVYANHSWGNYHWARTSNPFTLKLADNLSSSWDPYLITTSSDWSQSSVLDTIIVTGSQNPRRCKPTSGRVEVCNYRYGNNGWLGLAQIWASGNHIIQGVGKVNDTYFNTAAYNTPAWKNLVMCQEVAHTFGLDHQDEIFNNLNLGTCMDYTNNPAGPPNNEHPNQHDYDQLITIYSHLDSLTTLKSGSQKLPLGLSVIERLRDVNLENISDWGRELRNNGRLALFERDFGQEQKVFTFVIWAN